MNDETIFDLRYVFHVVEHAYLAEGRLSRQSFSGTFSNPVFLTGSLNMIGENDIVILSHDEFFTYLVKQVQLVISNLTCKIVIFEILKYTRI